MWKAKAKSQKIIAAKDTGREAHGQAALPWDDARVREVLGATADPQRLGRRGLIFAMDATASRQPTWDRAIEVQAGMFSALTPGLKVQLVYFRGTEFRATPWTRKPEELAAEMRRVMCVSGLTQIGHVLSHAGRAGQLRETSTLVYVGDSMEEVLADLVSLAHKLRRWGVRAFMFQEAYESAASEAFRQIASITGGAHCRLGPQSVAELRELLAAAAAYAAGGQAALAQLAQHQSAARLLLTQMK
jgi:hypothetical protein